MLAALVLLVPAALLWRFTDAPLGFAAAWIGAVVLARGVRGRREVRGKFAMNVGFALAALGTAEIVLWSSAPVVRAYAPERYTKQYVESEDDLGYAPVAGADGSVECSVGSELIYATSYTIGADGLRVAPERTIESAVGSVLCFGGSFMFGEGLGDDATVPFLLERELEGRLHVHNLALHGWGPHQMLAQLQSGRVERVVDAPPRVAVYWAISDHVLRASGKRWWDRRGPLFEVGADGVVRRGGSFADLPGHPLPEPGPRGVGRVSWIARNAMRPRVELTPEDIDRWAAIVGRSRAEIAERFPGCSFHVVLADTPGRTQTTMFERLDALGIPVHRMSELVPDFHEADSEWRIHATDVHPSAAAAEVIARHLAGVVRQETEQAPSGD